MIGRAWATLVSFWGEEAPATSLALVRICLAACWLYDLLHIWRLGLVVPLFGVEEVGGWSHALTREPLPWWAHMLPPSADSAMLLHGVMTLSALTLLLGLFSRTSALVLLLAWLQWIDFLPTGDRGIDQLSRHLLLILMFAPAAHTLSIDAWWRTGRAHDPSPAPDWGRKLVIGQMVLMYFTAGVLKSGVTWWPMAGYAALYFALQDPSVAAYDFSWTRNQPWFFFTQIGTAATVLYQATYPLVLLLLLWRRRPDLGGRLARFCNRYRVEWLWLLTGAWFHVSLGAVMNLGIFPWAMLALYPAWVGPNEWSAVADRLRRALPTRAAV